MAELSQLTDRGAVVSVVSEMQRLGRLPFLRQYGFDQSRDYFLRIDGELYDSKAIVAAGRDVLEREHLPHERQHVPWLVRGDLTERTTAQARRTTGDGRNQPVGLDVGGEEVGRRDELW